VSITSAKFKYLVILLKTLWLATATRRHTASEAGEDGATELTSAKGISWGAIVVGGARGRCLCCSASVSRFS
jgi:hypothetical protein